MNDFERIYANLDHLGPGSDADTLRALSYLAGERPARILDIGCGTGPASRLLLGHTTAKLVALDDYPPNLDTLSRAMTGEPAASRLETCCADMAAIPFPGGSFDWLWAEGSAYVIGFTHALALWKPLLAPGGKLVVSDLVWRGDSPSAAARDFWQSEYPDMTTASHRRQQIADAGYALLADFELSDGAWLAYYQPLRKRLDQDPDLAATPAGKMVATEISAWERDREQIAYACFVLGT